MKKNNSTKIKGWLVMLAVFVLVITAVWFLDSLRSRERNDPQVQRQPKELPTNTNPDWLQYTTVRSFGWPITNKTFEIREFTQFTVGYDNEKKQAAWVAYELLPAEVEGNVGNRPRFKVDPAVKNSASPDDYTNSGYDRGHLAPAADFTFSREAMAETFYMSNISPQEPDFNRGIWRLLEEQTRRWSLDKGRIWVVTGPVFGKRSKRIGTNRVAVPKGFYKALFSPDTEPPAMIGFYFPNQYSKDPIQMAAIPIDSVEGICECNMYSTLPVPLQSKLEVNLDTSKWF